MSQEATAERTARDAFLDRLRTFEGRRAAEPLVGPDAVNEAMIRHWCELLGDANPVYTDADAAARSVHGRIVAPPTMLQVWTMRGPQVRGGPGSPSRELLDLLGDAGYTSVVATDCEQEYVRYLRPGDRVTATTTIESISEEKRTALGAGHFITTLVEYRDADGELVGTQRFRLLRYRPAAGGAASAPPTAPPADAVRRPGPAMSADTAFFWEGCRKGELRIQRCAACETLRHPPRPACGRCGSMEWDFVVSTGRGTVHSFVVHHHPPVPGFAPPFVVVLVHLEEGTRIVSNLIGAGAETVRIGMPVAVTFDAVDEELTVPLFRVAR